MNACYVLVGTLDLHLGWFDVVLEADKKGFGGIKLRPSGSTYKFKESPEKFVKASEPLGQPEIFNILRGSIIAEPHRCSELN